MIENLWYATDRKDNALATASHAAEPSSRHVIKGIRAGFNDSTIAGTIVIKEGEVTKVTIDFVGSVTLDQEIELSVGVAISVELSASGTGGKYGSLLVTGYTK